MANLKRNMIELVKNVEEVLKGGEVETERFWTPPFIPFAQVREALQLASEMEKAEKSEEEGTGLVDVVDKLADFIVKVYGNQFTKDDIYNRLHGPGALQILQENILFIAQGVESSNTKKFLAEKKN